MPAVPRSETTTCGPSSVTGEPLFSVADFVDKESVEDADRISPFLQQRDGLVSTVTVVRHA